MEWKESEILFFFCPNFQDIALVWEWNEMYHFNYTMYLEIVYKYGLVMRAIVQNICPREFG